MTKQHSLYQKKILALSILIVGCQNCYRNHSPDPITPNASDIHSELLKTPRWYSQSKDDLYDAIIEYHNKTNLWPKSSLELLGTKSLIVNYRTSGKDMTLLLTTENLKLDLISQTKSELTYNVKIQDVDIALVLPLSHS